VLSSASEKFYSHYWAAGSVDAATTSALATVFDQFRCVEVCIEYIPYIDFWTIATPAPVLISALDFDDTVLLTAVSTLRDYTTSREGSVAKYHARRFQPNIRIPGLSTASNMTVSGNSWFDLTNFTGTQFLGSKWYIGGMTGAPSIAVPIGEFRFSAILEFRQAR
jgi:hypothetical protein